MHGHSRHVKGVPSPPGSPAGSPRRRRKGVKVRYSEKLVYIVIWAVFRRKGLLLFAPLLYIVGMMMYMGSMGLGVVPDGVAVSILRRTPPGSVYRSPKVYERLWPHMQADGGNSSLAKTGTTWTLAGVLLISIVTSFGMLLRVSLQPTRSLLPFVCLRLMRFNGLTSNFERPVSVTENKERCFCLGAQEAILSKFQDIFDEEYFTARMSNHVRIVKVLPADVFQRFDNNMSNIENLRVKAWSSKSYYMQKVLSKVARTQVLRNNHINEQPLFTWSYFFLSAATLFVIRIAPFSSRLAHTVPSDIQGIRCLANYEALRFSQPIRELAVKMVNRMLRNSSTSGGKYISVHLRFEKDMVAFSLCVYDGGKEEKHEMDDARERGWRGKFKRPHRILKPGSVRLNGKCPLTPLEVGMILRGMGFDNTTSVYLASGKIYKAEKYMAPLRQLFPRIETKETLASEDELAPFKSHSSRLAALDYTVCLYSEVFVTTQGGNFPHFMMGHRRYIYEGHSRTLNPDKRKLVLSFDNPGISWWRFKQHMQEMLRRSDVKGIETRKPNASVYTFPMPDCMCRQEEE